MIDVFMISVTTIATVLVVLTPFAILEAVGAFTRRRLIAKLDAATVKVNEATADISGAYSHRPELKP